MILHPDKVAVELPRGVPGEQRKPRVVTPEMRAANKANAQKSTGPKNTDKTRFNGVVHGMSSQEILFLEGEDPQEFWTEVDQWCQESDARTGYERACIADAVYSRWVKRRVINSQVHAVNDAVDKINYHFLEKKEAEVQELIPQLKEKPALTVTALMNSTAGCVFLINEFTVLSERLTRIYSFEVSQRREALRAGGHCPKDLFRDKVVAELNRSYLGSINGPGGFTAAGAANAFIDDQPGTMSDGEFERRLEPLVVDLPAVEEGHAQLQLYVNQWLERLTERKELVGYREEREKQTAIGKAQVDVSAEGEKRNRYLNQSVRTFQAAMRLMLAFKADRRKQGDQDECETTPEVDPVREEVPVVETAAEGAVIEAVASETPSEAVVAEVVGPEAGCNEVLAAATDGLPDASPEEVHPFQVLFEAGGQGFKLLRESDPICVTDEQ
jgi:hypothetical protein